jgi:acylphosphatase
MDRSMTTCKKVTYWGKVQGVGFRYTASEIAHHYPVTGYVINLLDGQVELVAEGEANAVDAFLAAVAGKLAGYIKGHQQQDETPQGYAGFSIRS